MIRFYRRKPGQNPVGGTANSFADVGAPWSTGGVESRPDVTQELGSAIPPALAEVPLPGAPRWAALHGLPAGFWWLWVGTLVNRAGTFIEPFFILYLTGPRHVSISTAGLVLTVWGFGSLVAAVLWYSGQLQVRIEPFKCAYADVDHVFKIVESMCPSSA